MWPVAVAVAVRVRAVWPFAMTPGLTCHAPVRSGACMHASPSPSPSPGMTTMGAGLSVRAHAAHCCTLHAAHCHTLQAAHCHTLHAARCMLHAATRCTLHAAPCTLHTATRCTALACQREPRSAACHLPPAVGRGAWAVCSPLGGLLTPLVCVYIIVTGMTVCPCARVCVRVAAFDRDRVTVRTCDRATV